MTAQNTADSDRVAPTGTLRRRIDYGVLLAFVAAGAATLYLSFNAGGFFVTAPAAVTVAVLAGLFLRVLMADRPFDGIGPLAVVAISGLALFSVWTVLSAVWSHAPARALIEFDRALLYTASLALFASLPYRAARVRALLGGLVFATVVVAVVALITRLLPHGWPLAPDVSQDRLSYPLTYWNALGLLVGFGIVGALYFATVTSVARGAVVVRVLAAAAVPVLATTLYFTLSRGAIAATVAGAFLFLVIARPRGALPALIAVLPTSAVPVLLGYHAGALTSVTPTSALAVHQGHRVALALAIAVVVAGLLRLALMPLERRLRAPRVRLPVPEWTLWVAAVVVVAAVLAASGVAKRAVDSFGNSNDIANLSDQRSRLLSVSNNGRFQHWHVALEAFRAHPLDGTGAGTFETQWAQHRPNGFTVINAHSLYLQVMGELGIVGLLLLLVGLVALLVALARRIRGPDRALGAAVFAAFLMWAANAGIDWDWEMPAVTLWVFALGGASVASGAVERAVALAPAWSQRSTLRLVLGLFCLLVGVTPVLLGLSQIHLDRASAALDAGDCNKAISESLTTISILSVRPQPYELAGICDVRLGQGALGVQIMQRAVDRDPEDWEYSYGLAIVQAAARIDPRAAARRAHELNQYDPRTAYALQLYDHGDPAVWQQRSEDAPLPP